MANTLHDNINERYNTGLSVEPPFPTKRMKIEISNHCNHSCIFCNRNKMKNLSGLIDPVFYEKIMQQAYDDGVREVGLFINGEPFTNPDLAKYVKIAKDIGYEYVYVTTNGALATPQRIKEVIDAGLDSIKFSINAGTRENYHKIHGRDDFEKVIEHLKYANEYRIESGKKYNIFGSFVFTNITADETDLFKEKFGHLFDDFAFYKARRNGMAGNEGICDDFTVQKRCTLPFNTININYDGELLACCEDVNHAIPVANLNEIPLRQAWYNETMKAIRQAHIDMDFDSSIAGSMCKECLSGGGGTVEVLDL